MPLNRDTVAKLAKLLTGLHKLWPDPPQDVRPWLIVDDSQNEAELYSYVFTKLGVKTEWANGPAHARGIMMHQRFAGVVVDFQFPGEQHGLDFAEELQTVIQPGVFVMYLTGNAKDLEMHLASQTKPGPYVLVQKTVDPLRLDPAFQVCIQMARGVNGEVKPRDVYLTNMLLLFIAAIIGSRFQGLIDWLHLLLNP